MNPEHPQIQEGQNFNADEAMQQEQGNRVRAYMDQPADLENIVDLANAANMINKTDPTARYKVEITQNAGEVSDSRHQRMGKKGRSFPGGKVIPEGSAVIRLSGNVPLKQGWSELDTAVGQLKSSRDTK